MIKIRMSRLGRRHKPFYRINVMDVRCPRNGKVIEQVGFFDPTLKDENGISLKKERIEYWLGKGAQTSGTVRTLLTNNGIEVK